MKLSAKQEMFCKEYMIDLNATQAAIRAGYSERTAYSQGQRLLKHVEVLARVKELKDKRADELELDAYWVLKRLKDISDRSMQAEPVMEYDHGSQELVETGEYQFDSTGANKATELIGKHIGMFDPKLQLQMRMMEAQVEKVKVETKKLQESNKDIEPPKIIVVDKWSAKK
ncbi:terminase small subunit [Sporosarcina sp. FSL K6-1522]|uniref:terminase small subunit n=1 Tax=Sporosarcina sp. FSL K6-1522 TaxID=2921554 RepID=UPI003159E6A5